jgi:hypothetical protein
LTCGKTLHLRICARNRTALWSHPWSHWHYDGFMAGTSKARSRSRGEVEELPSGSPRVRVYVGIDPVSKKKHFLTETVAAGPKAVAPAKKVRTRLLGQVDERRAPRTNATVNQRWIATWRCWTSSPRHGIGMRVASGPTSARCSVSFPSGQVRWGGV